ncbi:MAG: hypothetical protein ACYC6Y_06320, partial [Thermoguttaceae bacterium]
MRGLLLFFLVGFASVPGFGAVVGEPKQPYEDLASDRPCRHEERVQTASHAYTISFGGTVDGTMTRDPVGYSAFRQGWQPNRSLLIENVGQTDVLNPRIVVNQRRNWWSLEEVVAEATRGYTSDADRARALWEFARRGRFHACTWDNECSDALKALNVYGYTLCGNQACVLNDLWKAAGLVPRRGYPVGHVVCEVFYDGDFHLLDSDEHVICLQRDNRTIASCTEVVHDHDLIKRTHTYGIGQRDHRQTDEFSASLYSYEGERKGDLGNSTTHSMDLILRPGESIEFRWDHVGKEYSAGSVGPTDRTNGDGQGSLLAWGPVARDNLRNGRLCYRPDLSSDVAERGAAELAGVVFDTASGALRVAPDTPASTETPAAPETPASAETPAAPAAPAAPETPAAAERSGSVTWQFASPYVLVGGKASAQIQLEGGSSAQWQFSTDRQAWTSLATASGAGESTLEASLDRVLSPREHPTYRYWLRLTLKGDALARTPLFAHDIQTSLLALPELEVGTNRVAYSDSGTESRQVRITHQWLDRKAWHRPQAPAAALAPADEEAVAGSRVTFRWQPAEDPDGDRMVDYHFELSEHADMRWPLSPNFEKRTSLTSAQGKPEYTLPAVGLLNPGTTYYWRVRALDATGVWGPFSKTFSFRIQAPGVPVDVRLLPADDGQGLALSWSPNPEGERPVAYKVYGSDETGFSISDE